MSIMVVGPNDVNRQQTGSNANRPGGLGARLAGDVVLTFG
jgi:hypothetical protein